MSEYLYSCCMEMSRIVETRRFNALFQGVISGPLRDFQLSIPDHVNKKIKTQIVSWSQVI
jgi:hypothetical protein